MTDIWIYCDCNNIPEIINASIIRSLNKYTHKINIDLIKLRVIIKIHINNLDPSITIKRCDKNNLLNTIKKLNL